MGTVLQKTDNEVYVQRMITLMYQRSDVSNKINRGGLATAMGLVTRALKRLINGFSAPIFNVILMVFILFFPSSRIRKPSQVQRIVSGRFCTSGYCVGKAAKNPRQSQT